MTSKKRVFIMGGDRGGWALDTEARLARDCLVKDPTLELVDTLHASDIVHTVWPEQLLEDPACEAVLKSGRPIVASFSNDPYALFERVPGLYSLAREWYCVGQSTKAFQELKSLGIRNVGQVNYCADFGKFPVRESALFDKKDLRKKYGLPEDAYIISSFQRDTEGAELSRPKRQKGPDIFRAILWELRKTTQGQKIHVLLAGPRRHWLRDELRRFEIPFTFVGKEVPEDDYPWQNLPLSEIAQLLSASDLNLVTSRWEGGPRALMECAALRVKVLSTPEGIAEDLLEPGNIYRSLPEAVEKICSDISGDTLLGSLSTQASRLQRSHSVEAISKQWETIYRGVEPKSECKTSFLRDYPVHHPQLHRWLRRAKNMELRVKKALHGKSRAQGFHSYATVADWKADVAKGKNVSCPIVLKPYSAAYDVRGGAVLCHSGKGVEADEKLVRECSLLFPGTKFFVYTESAISDACLLITTGDELAPVVYSLTTKIPVIFAKSEKIKELVGFGGFELGELRISIEKALKHLKALSLCVDLPGISEHDELLQKLANFQSRGVLAC